MSEYDRMKAQKEEILSRELQVICSSCGGTCIYKREGSKVTFTHYCGRADSWRDEAFRLSDALGVAISEKRKEQAENTRLREIIQTGKVSQ